MDGLITLLNKIISAWKDSKDKILESSDEIVKALHNMTDFGEARADTPKKTYDKNEFLKESFYTLKSSFDSEYGGFGSKPKFPTPHNLWFLLEYYKTNNDRDALNMVETTLDAMYSGGIYDHIGFGFSRYSTDRLWLVPHFEKMLYDNALLAILYSKAYETTKKEKFKSVANEIFTYLLRDMKDEKDGFYSAEDADSEGIEGKFYVWALDEIYQVLGKDDGEKFASYFNITEKGNFEGFNIPNLINKTLPEDTEFINRCKQELFNYRDKRIHPYKDNKILTSWNGLAIAAFALGGRLLNNNEYTFAAESALEFIYKYLFTEDGKLLARYREGESKIYGYVDDYAFLTWALLELYESTNQESFLQRAINLTSDFVKFFWDDEKGGFFLYGSHGEQLITRPKKIYDGAIPSGNSVASLNFLKLYKFTSNKEYINKATAIFNTFSSEVSQHPSAYCFLLLAMIFYESLEK